MIHSSASEQTHKGNFLALTVMQVSKILSEICVHSGSSTTLLFAFKI